MIELRHLDVRHFVTEESRHIANGFTGLILFRYLSCAGALICDIIEFVSVHACRVCDALIASCATVHYASMDQNVRR